jgi:hypothetical protein
MGAFAADGNSPRHQPWQQTQLVSLGCYFSLTSTSLPQAKILTEGTLCFKNTGFVRKQRQLAIPDARLAFYPSANPLTSPS